MKRRIILFGAILVLGIAAIAAKSQRAGGDPPQGTYTLKEAQSFADYPLYYAGDAVLGLPLNYVLKQTTDNTLATPTSEYTVSFIYGDCNYVQEDGCTPPLEIQNWPACVRNPSLYAEKGTWGVPIPEETTLRGVPAAFFEEGRRVEVQTGTATVVVFGPKQGDITTVVGELRGVNSAVVPTQLLRNPAPGAMDGTLGC